MAEEFGKIHANKMEKMLISLEIIIITFNLA